MRVVDVTLPWEGGQFSGRLARPVRPSGPALLLAHGAGTDQEGLAPLRDGLAGKGLSVLTFNYPYADAGRRRPDREPVLLACHRAALEWLRREVDPHPVLSGRSMGGRMGTLLAADGAMPGPGAVRLPAPSGREAGSSAGRAPLP
ncbi:MAG: alpha/beta family hydrolase, partial [Acidimicrobiia bacterium]